MACHNCGRTFLPERLEVHLRSCNKSAKKKDTNDLIESSIGSIGGKSTNSQFSTPDNRNKPIKGGDSSTCNLCGRNFSPNLME